MPAEPACPALRGGVERQFLARIVLPFRAFRRVGVNSIASPPAPRYCGASIPADGALPMRALILVLASAFALSGCAVVGAATTVVGTAVDVTSTVVKTTADVVTAPVR